MESIYLVTVLSHNGSVKNKIKILFFFQQSYFLPFSSKKKEVVRAKCGAQCLKDS